MINPATFKARFPEFNSVNDTLIQTLLDESYLLLSNSNKYQDTMVFYYTAHNLVITQRQNNSNSTPMQLASSKSVGNVSTSYTTPQSNNSNEDFYLSTSYGQKYLEYKRAMSLGNVKLV